MPDKGNRSRGGLARYGGAKGLAVVIVPEIGQIRCFGAIQSGFSNEINQMSAQPIDLGETRHAGYGIRLPV